MLHLQGFDHGRLRDSQRMERCEAQILGQMGFTDPYSP
jgi:ssRNA-specific RNase YbeY (16S rRNA maturation enzyme)